MVQPRPASSAVQPTPTSGYGLVNHDVVPKQSGEANESTSSKSRTPRAASPEADKSALAGQYSGPASAYAFLRRAWRRLGLQSSQQDEAELNQAVPIFQYGDKQLPRGSDGLSSVALPDQQETTELFSIYFDFAMPT